MKRKKTYRKTEAHRTRKEEYLTELQEDISSSSGFVSVSEAAKEWIRNLPTTELYKLYGRKAE